MHAITSSRALAVIFMAMLFSFSFAQSRADGDALSSYLGKSPENSDFKALLSDYKLEMATDGHYLSKDGIELILKNGVLNQINLYKTSTVYGDYMGKLPHGLAFSMPSANVKQLLGKPKIAYTSGYAEFDMSDCVIACWFDADRLSQVSVNQKGGE